MGFDKIFELGGCWLVLTICLQMIYSKKHRKDRKYILKEIKEGRGLLKEVQER